jgi:uncharacterized protein YndB with AHSA1/START domain
MIPSNAGPVAKASLLVRRPVTFLYNAFIDPTVLTQFWLASASGPLVAGDKVEWEFMVPGAKDTAEVLELVPDERIVIRWSDGSQVTWRFTIVDDSTSIVAVEHRDFSGSGDELLTTTIESTQGFTIVLCALKALLETGTPANLVQDKARLIEMEQQRKQDRGARE